MARSLITTALPPISSPLKSSLSGAQSFKFLDNYNRDFLIDGNHVVQFYEKKETITIEIPHDEIAKLLNVNLDSNGKVSSVDWADDAKKADFILAHCRYVAPPQFIFRCVGHRILSLSSNTESRGKKKTHNFVVLFWGKCMGSKHGCEASYHCGFEEDQLRIFANDGKVPILMYLNITGHCTHRVGYDYSLNRGQSRRAQVNKLLGQDKLIRPSAIAQRNLDDLDASRYAYNNTDGVATKRTQVYEMNREAKKEIKKKFGLGKCKFTNMIVASEKIREMDIGDRSKIGDASKDLLGIVRSCTLHDGFEMQLYTKNDVLLMAELCAKGTLVVYYDGTGQLIRLQGTSFADKVLHSRLSFNPAETMLCISDRRYDRLLFTDMTLAEHVSNRQSGDIHTNFVKKLLNSCEAVYGSRVVPRMVNTDQAGQLGNGWVTGSRLPGQVMNRIMWNNVVTLVLLWFDRQVLIGNAEASAKIAEEYLRPLIPLYIHECKNHVCMGGKFWIESKDRPKEVKALGDKIISIVKHTMNEITSIDDFSSMIVQLCSVICLLRATKIPCSSYDITSGVRDHRDKNEMNSVAANMKELKDTVALSIQIESLDEVKDFVEKEMKDNEREWKQQFSGVAVSRGAMVAIEEDMIFSYSYLHKKDVATAKAEIHTHIVYDTVDDDGTTKPVFAGFFNTEVDLPFVGGPLALDNPVRCLVVADYLEKEFLKKPSLIAKCPVNMLQLALGIKIFGNNMSAEGLVNKVKRTRDIDIDASEPASWAYSRWNEQRRAGKTFVKEHEQAGHILQSRKAKAALKVVESGKATLDAIENELINNTDTVWGTSMVGPKKEMALKSTMNDIFDTVLPMNERHNKNKFKLLEEHMENDSNAEGNLKGMQYNTFNAWMNGKRAPGNRIGGNVMQAFQSFIRMHESSGSFM